jgi:hypothetical protein
VITAIAGRRLRWCATLTLNPPLSISFERLEISGRILALRERREGEE